MTTVNFIRTVQDYYGLEYSKGMGKVIVGYLDKLTDEFRPHLLAETLRIHSATYKALPDVSVFETATPEARVAMLADRPARVLSIEAPRPEELATPEQIEEFNRDMAAKGIPWRVR